MQTLGFILAVLIGVSIGLIGSGVSVCAIPKLVYIMHIAPSVSSACSFFIVGDLH